MAIGGDDLPPGQWDDELSSWPEDRRRVVRRRIAFVTVCVALVALIILTIVFVGNDKESARVATNEVSTSTLGTIGFAPSLPVAATVTSLSDSTTTSTSTSTTTLSSTTTTAPTTTASSTTSTTAPPPPFVYASHPKENVVGQFSPGNAQCPAPASDEPFTFDTPVPGTITITRQGRTASGPVDPQGNFDVQSNQGGVFDRYVAQTTQTSASGTYQRIDFNCPGFTYTATWNFP